MVEIKHPNFGTGGVRGDLSLFTPSYLKMVMDAVGRLLKPSSIVLLCDERPNCKILFRETFEAIGAVCDVEATGFPTPSSTPIAAYESRENGVLSVMCTASHNAYEEVGLKFYWNGKLLDGETTDKLKSLFCLYNNSSYKNVVSRFAPNSMPNVIWYGRNKRQAEIVNTMGLCKTYLQVGHTFCNPEDQDFWKATHKDVLPFLDEGGSTNILTNDIDGDRLFVARMGTDGARVFNGNETAALLCGWVLKNKNRYTDSSNPLVVTTRTTTPIISFMCKEFDVDCHVVDVGFKNIASHIDDDFLFGCEESGGYLVGPQLGHDKDGLQAGLIMGCILEEYGSYEEAYRELVEPYVNLSYPDPCCSVKGWTHEIVDGRELKGSISPWLPEPNLTSFTASLQQPAYFVLRQSGTQQRTKVYVHCHPSAEPHVRQILKLNNFTLTN